MKPIVISFTDRDIIEEMAEWIDKNLPNTAHLEDSSFIAFGSDEDWILWKMRWSGTHHHIGDRVWANTEQHRAEEAQRAAFRSSIKVGRTSLVLHPHGFDFTKGAGR